MQSLLARLKSARRPLRVSELAAQLEVDRRTIFRDLEYMRNQMNLPIVRTRQGQWLTEKVQVCALCAGRIT